MTSVVHRRAFLARWLAVSSPRRSPPRPSRGRGSTESGCLSEGPYPLSKPLPDALRELGWVLERRAREDMSTMTVPCGFCGQRGKIDNEHVWADWISRALAPMKMRIEFGRNEKVRTWTGDAINMTVRAFCQSCNSGWMSELEAATKPTLSPMLKGVPKVLGTTDERLSDAAAQCAYLVGALYREAEGPQRLRSPSVSPSQ